MENPKAKPVAITETSAGTGEPKPRHTPLEKLHYVRHGWAGQHPIQIEWLEGGDVHTAVVHVLNVDHTAVTLTTEEPRRLSLGKLVRVNGALTRFGATFEALSGRRGQVVSIRYAKSRTGEVKEYTGICGGVKKDKHLTLIVDGRPKLFILENIQAVDLA
jgi:hypothetical protein